MTHPHLTSLNLQLIELIMMMVFIPYNSGHHDTLLLLAINRIALGKTHSN